MSAVITNLVYRCAYRGDESACRKLDFFEATTGMVAVLARELQAELVLPANGVELVSSILTNVFVADVDPDGTAASPTRYFLSDKLSGARLASRLELATDYRSALSNIVASIDKEIMEMKRLGKEGQ